MVIISYPLIREFIQKYPDAKDVMNNWYRLFDSADCANFHELKQLANSVDAVGNDRFVFNVGGNKYRIIAMIFYDIRTIYLRFVGTHKEYDKIKDVSQI